MNLKEALSYALDRLLDSGLDHAEGVINESEIINKSLIGI